MTKSQKITKMIETGIVSISNDLLVPSFEREAKLNFFGWQPVAKLIQLDFIVSYVGEEVPKRLNPYSVTLVADTTDNEYDYFVDISKGEIKIFELIYDTIMLRDSEGKFNK
jgi:hypothetical protein